VAVNPSLVVSPGASIRETLEAITKNSHQAVIVVEADGRLAGLVTDGDLRRAILRGVALDAPIPQAMNPRPTVAAATIDRGEALALMRARRMRHLPLVDDAGRVVDVLLLEELLETGRIPNHAVLMAGGDGKRLRPLTDAIPKPLLRVGGKPILEVLMERLRAAGVRTFHITVRHKSQMIEEHFGDGSRHDVAIRYIREDEPLGTAGALTQLSETPRDPFFLVNGDILTKCDFRGMLAFHRRAGADVTVGTVRQQIDLQYGVVEVEGDRLTTLSEKPRLDLRINGGIYVIEPSVLARIPRGRVFDATDLVRLLLADRGHVAAFPIRDYWLDVGRLDDFHKADRDVAEGLLD
jgi:dTDP-glucose pyrophosphorylase